MSRNMRCSDTGKDVYFVAAAADRAADKQGRKYGRLLFTYVCPHCHLWHLTKRNRVVPIMAAPTAEKTL